MTNLCSWPPDFRPFIEIKAAADDQLLVKELWSNHEMEFNPLSATEFYSFEDRFPNCHGLKPVAIDAKTFYPRPASYVCTKPPLMKDLLKTILRILFLLVYFAACAPKEHPDSVRITIIGNNINASAIRLMTTNSFSLESTVAEAQTDSTAKILLEFPLSGPTMASLETGKSVTWEKRTPLYLAPGYDLEIRLNASGRIAHCKGEGSESNTYLATANELNRSIVWAGGKHINELDSASFFHKLDSLDLTLKSFHRDYTDTIELSHDIADLLSRRNTVTVLALKQNYEWNAGARNGFKDRKRIEAIVSEIPFDSALLRYGVSEYAHLLHMNMHMQFYIPSRKATPATEDPFSEGASPEFAVDTKIENGEFSPGFKSFMKAKNVDYWLAIEGITPAVDTLYKEFSRRYPNSAYLPPLRKRYDAWLALAPGQPAPDFSGNTTDGRKISLTDLKGKIVYVDVWATWCGPCVAETPYMRTLQDRFSKNEKVAFVLISVDNREDAWRKKVLGDMKGLGTYSILEQEKDGRPPIMRAYQIWGIPRYILIDQAGKIVDVTAERPSSGDVIAAEINKLIAEAEPSSGN